MKHTCTVSINGFGANKQDVKQCEHSGTWLINVHYGTKSGAVAKNASFFPIHFNKANAFVARVDAAASNKKLEVYSDKS